MTIVGLDHVDQFFDIIRHHEAGTIPPTVMWGACPTMFDSTQAPAGSTRRSCGSCPIGSRATPPTGSARATARARDARAMAAMRRTCATRSSNVRRARRSTSSAACRTCAGRSAGRRFHQDQIGYHRPFPGAGAYRTHIPNLYLRIQQPSRRQRHRPSGLQRRAGDPGDLGIRADWMPPSIADRLAAL